MRRGSYRRSAPGRAPRLTGHAHVPLCGAQAYREGFRRVAPGRVAALERTAWYRAYDAAMLAVV